VRNVRGASEQSACCGWKNSAFWIHVVKLLTRRWRAFNYFIIPKSARKFERELRIMDSSDSQQKTCNPLRYAAIFTVVSVNLSSPLSMP